MDTGPAEGVVGASRRPLVSTMLVRGTRDGMRTSPERARPSSSTPLPPASRSPPPSPPSPPLPRLPHPPNELLPVLERSSIERSELSSRPLKGDTTVKLFSQSSNGVIPALPGRAPARRWAAMWSLAEENEGSPTENYGRKRTRRTRSRNACLPPSFVGISAADTRHADVAPGWGAASSRAGHERKPVVHERS